MAYIFLDESGDLGFDFAKPRTTKYFVIAFLITEDKKVFEKIIKKTHSELKAKIKKRIGTLHSVKEKPVTRKRLLKRVAKEKCQLMTIYLNKQKVYTKLQDEKQVLYNYVTNILLDRIISKKLIKKRNLVELIASRRETNKFFNENFKNYLNKKVQDNHAVNIKIEIKTPAEEKTLQAVDFVSWAIFRKLEYGDEKYYEIIKGIILEENPLFP